MGVTPGRKVVKQLNQDERWMSTPTDEEGKSRHRNGYDPGFSQAIGREGQESRREDWVHDKLTNFDCYDQEVGVNKKSRVMRYTPNLDKLYKATQTVKLRGKGLTNTLGLTMV